MTRLHRAWFLIGLLLLGQSAYAETLRLVADDWPPFTGVNLVNGGLATDIVRTALARAGYASELEQVPWPRALLGLQEGRYDVLVNTWYDEARTQFGHYSSQYWVNRVRFLKRRTVSLKYNNLAQLRQYPIAVARGYFYSAEFDNEPHLRKIPVHNFAMGLRMLLADRVKLTLEDESVARYYLAREAPWVRNAVEFLPKPLSDNGLHILVSLKNPEHARIVADFDQAIAAMKADGSYDSLLRQHMGLYGM